MRAIRIEAGLKANGKKNTASGETRGGVLVADMKRGFVLVGPAKLVLSLADLAATYSPAS